MAKKLVSLQQYRTDVSKEREGVWINMTQLGEDGPRLRIARWDNKAMQEMRRALSIQHSEALTSGDALKIAATEHMINVKLITHTILLDVEGLTLSPNPEDEGAEEWKYNAEDAYDTFMDEGFHDILSLIEVNATNSNLFLVDAQPTPEQGKKAGKAVKKASSSTAE